MSVLLRVTLPGPARTKKNSGRIVPRCKRHILLPSKAWQDWCDRVAPQLRTQLTRAGIAPIAQPVNCAALFYRDVAIGDAVGFYQGLADLLEHGGAVLNDKFIASWDGSRLLKDASRPRVELVLTTAVGE